MRLLCTGNTYTSMRESPTVRMRYAQEANVPDWLLRGFGHVWLRYLRYPWSKVYRVLFERAFRGAPLPPATSVEEVRAALAAVTWSPDGPRHLYDAISHPGAVWARRRDDCDGFAILAATLLARIDPRFAPLLVSAVVLPISESHTVCAFRDGAGEGYRVFDNARLREERYASLEEVAELLAGRGKVRLYWDVVRPADLRTLAFQRFKALPQQ